MTGAAVTVAAMPTSPGRGVRARRRLQPTRREPVTASAADDGLEASVSPPRVGVETLRTRWVAAFGAAQAALGAARPYLTPRELQEHGKRLAAEPEPTAQLLRAFARDRRASAPYLHLLLAPREARRLLGLSPGISACVFNLDGVLVGSASLHIAAWTRTFDEFLSRRVERTGGRFPPFNERVDYPEHVHGRPRLEGVRGFLASRGVRLPEGGPDDAPGAETVHGLANRKNELLGRLLEEHGLIAYAGSRRYLELARDAGIRCAVVSASAHMDPILERAGLSSLVDARVDAKAMVTERLAARPAPDVLLWGCRRLGTEPQRTAVFETTAAGVAAARVGGFGLVVGVDHAGDARALRDAGADVVVSGLADLLDRGLPA